MTEQIREIVRVNITRETVALPQTGFSTLPIAGDSDKPPAPDVIVLTFDADIVTDNVITLKVNGVLITQNFDTDNDTTMAALATKIQAESPVVTAVASGSPNRVITTTADGDETAPVFITEEIVSAGASQAGIVNVRTPAVRTKTFTSLAAVDVIFDTTDLERIAASIFFAQDPHPTSVKIGRVVNGNDWSDEITLINNADSDWYFIVITSRTQADVEDVSVLIETLKKQLHNASADSNIPDSAVSSDIASVFEIAERERTITMFNELAANTYPDVAWVAVLATKTPGSATWNFKTLTDVTPSDTLTDAQRDTILTAKNANAYFTVGGRAIMREGKTAKGEFIDLVHGTDFLESQMTDAIFAVLAAADKIPFTDQGIATVEGAIRATLDDFILSGFLASRPDLYDGQPYSIFVPAVADVSQADRANRILPDITFRATLAGAIHEVEVAGTVAV
ncbi:MAG: DUF3383 family protein [Candidatus Hydrogenedentes bacterium]|nr:DUF3383 family protein [Candidatus Hydrogenedentota bacterium]